MNKIVKNRYFDALLKLMLLSAFIHMVVLFIYSLLNFDISRFNFFKITNLDLFFPQLITNNLTGLHSFILGIILYMIIFFLFTKRK